MKVSVVVPTFHRPEALARCLAALEQQERLPDEVVVVCRNTDTESISVVESWVSQGTPPTARKLILVDLPGLLHAIGCGHQASTGDVVVFTDDDAQAYPDWLKLLLSHYDDAAVGGVGGMDVLQGVEPTLRKNTVGKLTWYGKVIGNHHCGHGAARRVDVLKGVNMSFRRGLVDFPHGLRGQGAQVHNEVYLCLKVSQKGYKLIYDPSVRVAHYPAERFDLDQRHVFVHQAVRDAAFNETLSLVSLLPWYRIAIRVAYTLLVGDRSCPGLVRFVVGVLQWDKRVIQSFLPAHQGSIDAYFFRSGMKSDNGCA